MTRKFLPTPEAFQLLHEGALALSEIESNGVRVDRPYLEQAIKDVMREEEEYKATLMADPLWKQYQRKYGAQANVFSPSQTAAVLAAAGYRGKLETDTGGVSASESSLEGYDVPFIKTYFAAQKLRKARGTYLEGILRELVQHDDGLWYVHPNYHLNTVSTFRSSCSNPNFQNQPSRNPRIAEIIRRSYVARPGHQLLEIDYGQIEVRIPCCYNFDPVLIEYVCDPSKDMHRDMACQIFDLPVETLKKMKPLRQLVKGAYVFATFYGSYYPQTAPALWEGACGMVIPGKTVRAADGTERPATIRDHLAEQGIMELGACDPRERPARGTFEAYIKEIDGDFWGRRFRVYDDWRKDAIAQYYREGGCLFLTGFPMSGPHKRNDITNYRIQGSAFHCTLWSLPRVNAFLRRYKMRSRVIGEIHDCINVDAHPRERDDVAHVMVEIMTQRIRKAFPWLNVPLTAEVECCPIDGSWFEKAQLLDKDGVWVPADQAKWESKYGPWERQCV